ncbi:hypothetical protein LAZ67_10001255 [Cordylochernes scorpioides]|uniref:Secreted protein n=1 Tax=Cordylochernes scorpioides TaxID=51811 RepID=A0ABY6KW88_9ARAC|nr:hypothetical protein LAZ67_10001255 [Cordylochernes scorpioides]
MKTHCSCVEDACRALASAMCALVAFTSSTRGIHAAEDRNQRERDGTATAGRLFVSHTIPNYLKSPKLLSDGPQRFYELLSPVLLLLSLTVLQLILTQASRLNGSVNLALRSFNLGKQPKKLG